MIRSLSLLLLLVALSCSAQNSQAEDAVYYLLRHAEKEAKSDAADPKNPGLTVEGQARAQALVRFLEQEELTGILSTDYIRTQDTVAPLAEAHGLEVESYNPRSLAETAKDLLGRQGRFVISGHSNTTPELVRLMGGDPGKPIDEATEFDRLYVLVRSGETVATLLFRMGSS